MLLSKPYPIPVSYTHLDVYKRQLIHLLTMTKWRLMEKDMKYIGATKMVVGEITASDLSDRMLADFLDMESTQIVTMHIPVSYTHLDVYKRQPLRDTPSVWLMMKK